MRPKVFRDPVHNAIALERDDPGDRLLLALIDTPELQRLRRIRQLGLAGLVFHGAEHSRFTHSLGAMHLARRILEAVRGQLELGPDERTAVLAAALLHDLGHGPLSHNGEGLWGGRHEEWSSRLVLDPGTAVHQLLAAHEATLPRRVDELVRGVARPRTLGKIVSGQLDCDRLDYILRDGWALGVSVTFDLTRLLGMVLIDQIEDRLVIDRRGHDAVEAYLIARYHLFRSVYHHKTVRAAGAMLGAAVRRASLLVAQGRLSPGGVAPGLARVLGGGSPTLGEYLALDDGDLWSALKVWAGATDPLLARLAGGLLHRRLYKGLQVVRQDPAAQAAQLARARDLLRCAGHDPDFELLVDTARDQPYRPYSPAELGPEGIFVRWPDGNREISETSGVVRSLLQETTDTRWFVPEELRPELRRLLGATA